MHCAERRPLQGFGPLTDDKEFTAAFTYVHGATYFSPYDRKWNKDCAALHIALETIQHGLLMNSDARMTLKNLMHLDQKVLRLNKYVRARPQSTAADKQRAKEHRSELRRSLIVIAEKLSAWLLALPLDDLTRILVFRKCKAVVASMKQKQ